MPKIVPIVEGDGEVTALPKLLYKLLNDIGRPDIQISVPKHAHGRGNLTKANGIEKFIRLCWKEPGCAAILVVLDAEKDCPVTLSRTLTQRAFAIGAKHPIAVVCANRMYEAWLLASIETIQTTYFPSRNLQAPDDADAIRDPKSWLDSQFPQNSGYKETEDQQKMTQMIDLKLASPRSRSFRKLNQALKQVIQMIDSEVSM